MLGLESEIVSFLFDNISDTSFYYQIYKDKDYGSRLIKEMIMNNIQRFDNLIAQNIDDLDFYFIIDKLIRYNNLRYWKKNTPGLSGVFIHIFLKPIVPEQGVNGAVTSLTLYSKFLFQYIEPQ